MTSRAREVVVRVAFGTGIDDVDVEVEQQRGTMQGEAACDVEEAAEEGVGGDAADFE